MANRNANIITRADLTNYAFGVTQDMASAMELVNFIAPIVPTGGTTGQYNTFETTQSFAAYATSVSRRAIGGQATTIGLLNDVATYTALPYGLRISIDQHERAQADVSGIGLLEQSKTRTLMINCMMSFIADVIAKVKAGVSATADRGDWQGANVDPIAEINDVMETIWSNTGIVPNCVAIDFAAWCRLKANPLTKKYFPAATQLNITAEAVGGLLINPNAKVKIVELSGLTNGGLGNSASTRIGVLGGSVLAFYSSPTATPYDPSFAKTFSPSATLFTEVYGYREEPHLDWLENNWTCEPKVISSALAGRIDVKAKV